MIWLPLIIALAVSVSIAGLCQSIFPFWNTFILATIGQFIVGSIANRFAVNAKILHLENIKLRQLEETAKQTLKLRCPCTNNVEQLVPIRLDQQNFYKCINCQKNINVALTAKTAMMTDIVDINATHNDIAKALADVTEDE